MSGGTEPINETAVWKRCLWYKGEANVTEITNNQLKYKHKDKDYGHDTILMV